MDLNTQLRDAREKVAALADEMDTIVAGAEGEKRGLTAAEKEKFDAHEAEMKASRDRVDLLERRMKVGPHSERINDTKLTGDEQKRYSLLRVIRALAAMKGSGDRKAIDEAGFELEISAEIAKRTERQSGGAYIPRQVLDSERRTLLTSVGSAGGYLVAEELDAGNFIGMLRNSAVVLAGATVLPGLKGDVLLPKQTGAGTHYWLSTEEADVTESQQAFGQVRLSPKHGAAFTRFSRQTLHQTSPGIEGIVTNDLNRIVGIALDRAALYGAGDGGEPLGLKLTTNVNDPTNFAAAIPTWAELMVMVGECALDNAIGIGGGEDGRAPGSIAWLLEGQQYANLMAKSKDAGSGMFVLDSTSRIGPFQALLTNNITTGDVWFGDWSQLLVGRWGDPEVIVNPYTNDLSGAIRIVVHHYADIGARHPQAFCFNNDG